MCCTAPTQLIAMATWKTEQGISLKTEMEQEKVYDKKNPHACLP